MKVSVQLEDGSKRLRFGDQICTAILATVSTVPCLRTLPLVFQKNSLEGRDERTTAQSLQIYIGMLVHHYVLGMKLRGARHTTRIHFCLTMMALDTIHSFSGHSEYILLIGQAVCLLVTGGEENGLKLCLAKAMRNLEMRLNPSRSRVG